VVLAAACSCRDAHHTGAARSLAVAANIGGRCRGLLKPLLAPLPVTLGALPNVLESDVKRRFPVIAWGRAKFGRLAAGGVRGGDAGQLLGGVPNGIGRCLEG
jgi:hypothetical protein